MASPGRDRILSSQSNQSINQSIMTILTQAQLRRLCVSENVRLAAISWREAMLYQQTPLIPLVCCEEDVTPDCEVRKLVSSRPHPTTKGRFVNTYTISGHKRELETYEVYMRIVKSCTDRSATFRKDGLGIWLV